MRREDGNSYTTEQEAVEMARECVEFGKQRDIAMLGFVQKRGPANYLVTPVEYKSFETLHRFA